MDRKYPYLKDDDKGEITVSLDGCEARGWSYTSDSERRIKMLMAREYVEGWGDGSAYCAALMEAGLDRLVGKKDDA